MSQEFELQRFKIGKQWSMKFKKFDKPKMPKKDLSDLIGGIDKDKIQDLLGYVQEEGQGESGIMDTLQDVIADNPELIKSFLSGLKTNKDDNSNYLG